MESPIGPQDVHMPKRRSALPHTAFAMRLIKVREAYGAATNRPDLDQKAFARILGFGEGQEEAYRRYERGETEPPLRVLAEIHRVTGASLDLLVGRNPSEPINPKKAPSGNVQPFPPRKRLNH